ncbi:MAG: VWA domain-containing protein, partial [Deltaproteobacteria bacterium]|nr:VWA domain-containing protein [Deltaproteobacteria bacterium]
EAIPQGPSGLRAYQAVILSDVPAYMLSLRQQEALQSYVRDLGRGLVMVGGDRSFGLGGYYRSPIEEALPVSMDIKDKTRFPKLGMVLAMDKSGSMGGGAGSKLGMAKEAGIQTAELLSDRDMLGVIGFDHAAAWIVPLTEMTNRAEVQDTIASIRVGGGTDIYPAIDRGMRGLQHTDASLKHIIVLSDGMTSPGDFKGLITRARQEQITLTAVAIGTDADRTTMQSFARWGGGNYYLVTDTQSIPAIFTRETLLATRSFLVEEPFQVTRATPSDLLKGMTDADFPTFGGYVATEAKSRAVVALTTEEEDPMPILVHWRYGLGRSVAFTSDLKTRWSKEWLGTEEYARFWTQVTRWSVGSQLDGDLDVAAEIREGELVVTVDAFGPNGGFRNFLEGEARVVAPDLSVRRVEMRQVAPGRYQAVTTVDQDGSWLVGVALQQGDEVVGQAVAEAIQPYSPEYRPRGAGRGVLSEVGRLGGGGVVLDPAQVFRRPRVARHVPHPLWPLLLALAAFLLLADVASRRLALGGQGPRLDPATLTAGAAAKRAFRKPYRPAAKQRVAVASEVGEVEDEPETPLPVPPIVEPDSYAGRLLAARRQARRKMGRKTGDEE